MNHFRWDDFFFLLFWSDLGGKIAIIGAGLSLILTPAYIALYFFMRKRLKEIPENYIILIGLFLPVIFCIYCLMSFLVFASHLDF